LYQVSVAILRARKRMRAKPLRGLSADLRARSYAIRNNGPQRSILRIRAGVREVKLDVLYCADCRNRNAQIPPARIGFVAEIQAMKAKA
jgi:hypothetical protein